MRASHRITAVLLAIFVASPLCCCFSHAAADRLEAPSCCASADPTDHSTPGGNPCTDCQAKSPRLADGGTQPLLLADLPMLADLSEFGLVLPRAEELAVAPLRPVDPDPGPPRLRLALHQSLLI